MYDENQRRVQNIGVHNLKPSHTRWTMLGFSAFFPGLIPRLAGSSKTKPLQIAGAGFHRPDALLSLNQQCQSIEGNSNHWLQPVKITLWTHPSLIPCPYSPNYIGCRSNTEYNTTLPLQCSRSWQHNSRATLPTSSGFVLLHDNFGPAEGICYTTIVLI